MESAKLSYAGIAGAVAGVLGLFGAVSKWYAVSLAGGTVTIKGTSDASGKLALAMSVALFAFSAAYVLIADARIRQSHHRHDAGGFDPPHDVGPGHRGRGHRSPFTTRPSAKRNVSTSTALRPALARNSPSAGRLMK